MSFQNQQIALANSSRSTVERLWDSIVNEVDDDTLNRFSATAARAVRSHQLRSVQLADSFVRTFERASVGSVSGRPVDPVPILRGLRNGTPLEEVYSRPVVTARAALSRGEPFLRAVSIGRERAASSAHTDATLASRAGTAEAGQRSSRVVGYRRVPDSSACPFCLLISTQRYRSGKDFESHSNCNCSMVPIIGSQDIGRVIDQERLDDVKASGVTVYKRNAAGERVSYNYKRDDLAVREHGELGPQITLAKHNFTTEAEVA